MRARTRRSVGWPTAAVMRRTWRFLPSVSSSEIQVSGTDLRTRIGGTRAGKSGAGSSARARQGRVRRPPISTPPSSRRRHAAVGTPSTWTQYSRPCPRSGSSRAAANPGSSVSRSKPSESASSRPTG